MGKGRDFRPYADGSRLVPLIANIQKMEVGGMSSAPSSFPQSKKSMGDPFPEVREGEPCAVRKHPSILLTDGRTLNFKKLDRKRVSFGRNTEFAISQVSAQDCDAMEVSQPQTDENKDAFKQFLEAPLTLFKENEALVAESTHSIVSSVENIFNATFQVNEELFSRLGISFTQPSESQLAELRKSNESLERRVKELQDNVQWVQARLERDRSEAGTVEQQLSAAEKEVQHTAEATLTSLQATKEQLTQQVAMYKRLTGISLPSFSGQVLTGVCKGKQDGELKFELHFRREGGCDYRPVTLRMHGLDEMLKHPINGLAECELVMVFRRMLQAVVYRDS